MSIEDLPFLQIYLTFSACVTVWELYLDKRQLKKNQEEQRPEEIESVVTQEKFMKSQSYQADKRSFSMVQSIISFVSSSVEVVWLWPFLWRVAADLVGENEYARSITWSLLTSYVNYPVEIPLSLYSDFVVEARHGFNKKTLTLFVTDLLKNTVLTAVYTGILVPVVIVVVRWGGEYFYIYIWAVAQLLIIVFMFIYPTLIMPLFNKFEPLRDPALRKKIEELAGVLKYPLTKLFQMDGSKRSAHSNAYMFGFGKNKRIVLFDTLLQTQLTVSTEAHQKLGFEVAAEPGHGLKVTSCIADDHTAIGKWNQLHKDRNDELRDGDIIEKVNDATEIEAMEAELQKYTEDDKPASSLKLVLGRKPYTDSEILAVLCHEIGHWFHSHVLQMLVINSVHIFVLFRLYAFVMYSGPLFASFGFSSTERSIMIGLSIFMLMFSPVETVLQAFMTAMTRKNEFQADTFAVRQNRAEPLGTGLKTLCLENLGDLNPDWLFAWFHHSHPSLLERLRHMKEKDAVMNKKEK